MTDELLTEKEKKLVRMLGECYGLWKEVYDEARPNSSQREYDFGEFSSLIHSLQYRVTHHAARRAYPGMFR